MNQISAHSTNWLELAVESLKHLGYAVIEDVLGKSELELGLQAVESVEASWAKTDIEIKERRNEAGRVEIQAPMLFDRHFLTYLSHPAARALIEKTVGRHATLRFQTVESIQGVQPRLIQNDWHQNFKFSAPEFKALDVIFLLKQATAESLGFEFAPGSHHSKTKPSTQYLEWAGISLAAKAGSLFVLDPRIWHREAVADEQTDRCLIHNLFVPHFVKPFLDYPRLLGQDFMDTLDEATRGYLGWNSRVPEDFGELYLPAEERLYKAGQWAE